MPNWFCGRLTLRSDDTEKMKELEMFVKMNTDDDGHVENECKVGDNFSNKYCPLDWTGIPDDVGTIQDDGTRWDFNTACNQWGSKWGIGRIITLDFDEVEGLRMRYNSAWSMPITMFGKIADKGYEVTSYGHCVDFYQYFDSDLGTETEEIVSEVEESSTEEEVEEVAVEEVQVDSESEEVQAEEENSEEIAEAEAEVIEDVDAIEEEDSELFAEIQQTLAEAAVAELDE